jgi:hypothetical protein
VHLAAQRGLSAVLKALVESCHGDCDILDRRDALERLTRPS